MFEPATSMGQFTMEGFRATELRILFGQEKRWPQFVWWPDPLYGKFWGEGEVEMNTTNLGQSWNKFKLLNRLPGTVLRKKIFSHLCVWKKEKKLNNKNAAHDVVYQPIIQFWSLISSPNSNIAINVAIKQQIAQTHTNAWARHKFKCVQCVSWLFVHWQLFTGFPLSTFCWRFL